jgi:hypothetical protein
MKYPPIVHFINILFLSAIFIFPFSLAIRLPNLSNGEVAGTILSFWALGALLFADWYHMHMTDTYKGCVLAIFVGLLSAVICLYLESSLSGNKVIELVKFSGKSWQNSRLLLKWYLAGIGAIGCGAVSIQRIILVNLFAKSESKIND